MKKLLLVCMVFLMGCATATFERGDMKLTVKRPIFSTVNATAVSSQGDTVTINTGASVQVDQLAALAIQGYAKYMSGGLASSPAPSVVLVPKADAQATPPPAVEPFK
jgi:hypothetical protein